VYFAIIIILSAKEWSKRRVVWEVVLTDYYVVPVAVVHLAGSETVFLNGPVHVRASTAS